MFFTTSCCIICPQTSSSLLSFGTFPIPSIFAFTFNHVFCSSRCPTVYPICPILCPGSALPAGHGERLPEGRTGVATHTPLSTQLPVASSGQSPNYDGMHTRDYGLTCRSRTCTGTKRLPLKRTLRNRKTK